MLPELVSPEAANDLPAVPSPASLPLAGIDPLPGWLSKALRKELCEGEEVRHILRPLSAGSHFLRSEWFWWLLTASPLAAYVLGLTEILAEVPGAFILWLLFAGASARGFAQLAGRGLRRRNIAYVVTNQRCFRIANLGVAIRVTEVDRVPDDRQLDPAAFVALHEGLVAVAAPEVETPPARDALAVVQSLPPDARQVLEASLQPGEQILWAERPTVLNYLYHVPVDGVTAALVCASGAGLVAAIASLSLALSHYLAPGTAPAAAAAGAAGLGAAAVASLHLRQRIRSTIYAVTSWRGIAVTGKKVKHYRPDELRGFQRTQAAGGDGSLSPAGKLEGFHGIRDVKVVDDLIKARATRDRSTEVVPAAALPGRGDETTPT